MTEPLTEQERVIQEADALACVVALMSDRIRRLPADAREDLGGLFASMFTADDDREKAEIIQAVKEILVPKLAGQLVAGSPTKAGALNLRSRSKWIGERIRRSREAMGMTQVQLAEASGLPQSHISRLESGHHSPSHSTLEKIATALKIDPKELDYARDE